jgi:hypothetical protein
MNALALARMLTTERSIDTRSALGPRSLCKNRRGATTSFLHPSLSPLARAGLLGDPSLRWAFIDSSDKIGVLTSLSNFDDQGTTAITTSATDELFIVLPTAIVYEDFHQSFIGLLSKDDIESAGFKYLTEQLPNTMEKPGTTPAAQNSLDELGFPGASAGGIPHFAILPKILHIPPGFYVPEGHSVLDSLPVAPTCPPCAFWDPFVLWFQAIQHAYKKTNKLPMNAPGNSLFDPAKINTTTSFPNVALSSTILASVTVLSRNRPYYTLAKDTAVDNTNATLLAWYHLQNHSPTPHSPGTPGSPNSASASNITVAVAAAVRSVDKYTASPADRAALKDRDSVKIQYQLLFALNGVHDDSPTEVLLPVTLSPRFIAVLDASKSQRTKVFQQHFNKFLTTLSSSEHTVDQRNTWTREQIDSPLANAIYHFNFLGCPLNRERTSLGHKISSAHFLTVVTKLPEFVNRVHNELSNQLQHLADEEKSKMDRKQTLLYFKGLQKTADHLRQCIYNINACGQFVTYDFPPRPCGRLSKLTLLYLTPSMGATGFPLKLTLRTSSMLASWISRISSVGLLASVSNSIIGNG